VFRPLVGIAVRVMLHRELAVGLLDVLLGSIAVDAQHRVVITLCHQIPCQLSSNPSTERAAPPLQAARPVRVNRRRRRRFNADRNSVAQSAQLKQGAVSATEFHFFPSFTSVNSASTTFSSFLPRAAPSPLPDEADAFAVAASASFCAWAYMISPSFCA